MRNEPLPLAYMALMSFGRGDDLRLGGKIRALDVLAEVVESVAFGSSRRRTQAAATSRRLWGGTSVAMPTAMPAAPFRSTWGRRAGSMAGSSRLPSKFGTQSTVPSPSSDEQHGCAKLP